MMTAQGLHAPPCPKCGHDSVELVYHGPPRKFISICGGIFTTWHNPERAEHVHCRCRRCGYDWPVLTARAEAGETGETA